MNKNNNLLFINIMYRISKFNFIASIFITAVIKWYGNNQ